MENNNKLINQGKIEQDIPNKVDSDKELQYKEEHKVFNQISFNNLQDINGQLKNISIDYSYSYSDESLESFLRDHNFKEKDVVRSSTISILLSQKESDD